jgi:hypothetical protein
LLLIRFVRRYVLSAGTFFPPIRFVHRYVFRRYVMLPICFVADTFCPPIRFVLTRFVADTFCPDTFCPFTVLNAILCD